MIGHSMRKTEPYVKLIRLRFVNHLAMAPEIISAGEGKMIRHISTQIIIRYTKCLYEVT